MKNKKISMYISIIIIILIILGLGYLVYINVTGEKENNQIKEFIPEEEITDEQLRKTNIELYYLDKDTNMIEKTIKQIDAKELIENPAKRIIEELLKEIKDEKKINVMPENTKINNIFIEKGIVYIDFSEEFTEVEDVERAKNIIEVLKKTMSQLMEIKGMKILINNEENCKFKAEEIDFKEEFIINN